MFKVEHDDTFESGSVEGRGEYKLNKDKDSDVKEKNLFSSSLQGLTAKLTPVQILSLSAKVKKLKKQLTRIDYSKCSSLAELEAVLSTIPLCKELFSKTKLEEIVMFAEAVGELEDDEDDDGCESSFDRVEQFLHVTESGETPDRMALKEAITDLKSIASEDVVSDLSEKTSHLINQL